MAPSEATETFSRRVPSKSQTSWGTTANCSRAWDLDMEDRGRPSIRTSPDVGSRSLVRIPAMVDLPAPVGPTIATVVPGSTSRSTPLRTSAPP